MKNLIVLLCFTFVGCTLPDNPQVIETNKRTLSGQGEIVGTLPNGRSLIRYEIDRGSGHSHWVYIVDDTITINHNVPNGKTTSNRATVIIDGITYEPKLEDQ